MRVSRRRVCALLAVVACGAALTACNELPFVGGADATTFEVYAWGRNDFGQLGDGTFESRSTPVKLVGLPGEVRQISAGNTFSVALLADGTVWAWGNNDRGQVASGKFSRSNKPVKVFGLNSITMVAAGREHGLAVHSDGTVYGWGDNTYGQLGTGTTNQAPTITPVRMAGVSNAAQVAAGWGTSFVLDNVGNLYALGRNTSARLGIGTAQETNVLVPTEVVGVAPVTQIDAGEGHGVALRYNNVAWAWGSDLYGQLGDDKAGEDPDPNPSPVRGFIVNDKPLAIGIAAGSSHTVVLAGASDGSANTRVWSVGHGGYGQMGNGTKAERHPFRVEAVNLTRVTKVDAGGQHTLALDSTGRVWAWGHNFHGAIGDGTTSDRTTPVQLTALTGVTTVSAGGGTSFAIRAAAG
jgi:alpha-tubulin suppressor-like RCC1 family protein